MITIACIHCNWIALLLLPVAIWVIQKVNKHHPFKWHCRSCKKDVDMVKKRCECEKSPSPWELTSKPDLKIKKKRK